MCFCSSFAYVPARWQLAQAVLSHGGHGRQSKGYNSVYNVGLHLRNSNFNDRKGVSSSPSLISPQKIDHLPSLKRTERRQIPETLLNDRWIMKVRTGPPYEPYSASGRTFRAQARQEVATVRRSTCWPVHVPADAEYRTYYTVCLSQVAGAYACSRVASGQRL